MAKTTILVIEELLERGDPAFLPTLRDFDDADRLAAFAPKWFADRRPISRKFLMEYFDLPMNAYRHEPLVKRIFKLAEAAGDDSVMAGFLVMLDRSIRRRRRKRYQWHRETGSIEVESIHVPRDTTMPRGTSQQHRNPRTGEFLKLPDLMTRLGIRGKVPDSIKDLPEKIRKKLEGCRLFTVHTRHYLRRRAWRYFRNLGKKQPDRYVPAVVQALKLYQDRDVADGLALIDNWGLVHILFHDSPVLVARANGWTLAEDGQLSALSPAPAFADLWAKSPKAIVELLQGQSRTVRQWALFYLRQDGSKALAALPLEELLALLSHPDADVAALVSQALAKAPGLDKLHIDRWLALLDAANASALDVLCGLIVKHLHPDKVTLEQAIALASRRPVPIARLGLSWLRSKAPQTATECTSLLALTEAQAESVRGEIVRWARQVLSASPHFQPDWAMEFLDCRHINVRQEGWSWLQEDPRVRDNVTIWRRLLESPYDDVRLRLVADLERRVATREAGLGEPLALDPELVRFLWASVLLNIYRGNRAKPVVVAQMVRRLQKHPGEAGALLPIVSVALRSVRGPEWRAGLAGVVQLVEQNPNLEGLVRGAFPELSWAV